jgi:hypothetical protein
MENGAPRLRRFGNFRTAWDLVSAWPYEAEFDPAAARETEMYWLSGDGKKSHIDKITYPIKTYVDALGLDLAAKFLFIFGGTEIYVTTSRGAVEKSALDIAMGAEVAHALRVALVENKGGSGPVRVHTGNEFLARYLRSKGEAVTRIAPILRTSEVSLRFWLLSGEERERANLKRLGKTVSANLVEPKGDGRIAVPSHHKLKPPGVHK